MVATVTQVLTHHKRYNILQQVWHPQNKQQQHMLLPTHDVIIL